jgi:cobalt-zinc-cadmium efflux system protein
MSAEHAHGHSHSHDHLGHAHGVSAEADVGKLTLALCLIVGFMAVEVVIGVVAQSLALLPDRSGRRTPTARWEPASLGGPGGPNVSGA